MSYASKMLVACNITAARIRKLRTAAKDRGRMVEVWCGGMPYLAVYPDGRLKLSGRGLGNGSVQAPKKESYAAYKRRMKRIAERARRTPGFRPYRADPYERD